MAQPSSRPAPDFDQVAARAQAKQQRFSRAGLAEAPFGSHLQLEADDVAELLELLLQADPGLSVQFRAVPTAEIPAVVVVAVGVFLRCPVKIRGGMFDENGRNREHPGNGWARMVATTRGRRTYTASTIRKAFNARPDLWLPDHQKVESRSEHGFTNYRARVDGTPYASTGIKYPRYCARRITFLPAEAWRLLQSTALVQRLVSLLYRARSRRRTRASQILRAWSTAAGAKRHALRRRGITFNQSIAWSRRERSEARHQRRRLPKRRVASVADSISKKEPPLEGKTARTAAAPASGKGARRGRAGRGAAASRSGDHSAAAAARPAARPCSSDAGRGGRGTTPELRKRPSGARKRGSEPLTPPGRPRGPSGERLELLRERSRPAAAALEHAHAALGLGSKRPRRPPPRAPWVADAPPVDVPTFPEAPPAPSSAPVSVPAVDADPARPLLFRTTPPRPPGPARRARGREDLEAPTFRSTAPARGEFPHQKTNNDTPAPAVVHLAGELGADLNDAKARELLEELEAERRWRRGKR